MKLQTILKLMRFWPPFFGAGIKIKNFNPELTTIVVQMNMKFWNRNYVGTHFGGSLYSMCDPFYMLMLINTLGKGYTVWDKSASIRYKKPAKDTVFATFNLTPQHIQLIQETLKNNTKMEQEFTIHITDTSNEIVAEVKKILHISKRN
jgi:acyl-coenzyme A thioesterase PaaI-like protein